MNAPPDMFTRKFVGSVSVYKRQPRNSPVYKTLQKGTNTYNKSVNETVIEITGKTSSWSDKVIMIADRIKSRSKEDEFNERAINNKRLLHAIRHIKTPWLLLYQYS